MPFIQIAAIDLGWYISPAKLVLFLIAVFLWLPIVKWAYKDTEAVRTDQNFWTIVLFAAGAAGAFLALAIPFFIVGILLQLITIAAPAMAYVVHRNARVADFERVLTAEHIKSLFVNEDKKIQAVVKGLVFFTANKNEVEPPSSKTPEFVGFSLAQDIIDDALWKRTSEVSLVPTREHYDVIYKIDGVPTKQEPREREDAEQLILFLKHLADLDINEKRKPQMGIFSARKDDNKYEFRVTTAGSTVGEKAQIQRVEESNIISFEQLGFHPEQQENIKTLADKKPGVFIISGPPQSGVTTTFYALLRNHDPYLNNINTLEKKTAAELMNITQNVHNPSDSATISYARKLQTVLRTGPDIIGVGDCEDPETAELLANAAEKDKRTIYLTMRAPNIMQALAKWFKFVPDRNLAAGNLLGVSNQRLVRILCQECKEAYRPNRDMLKKFNLPADKVEYFYRQPEIEYDRRGNPILCDNCQGSGYFGRTGVFETVLFDDELRNMLKQAKSIQEIANHLRRAKMLYLQEQAVRKVAAGVTSINEVIRELSPPKKSTKTKKTS